MSYSQGVCKCGNHNHCVDSDTGLGTCCHVTGEIGDPKPTDPLLWSDEEWEAHRTQALSTLREDVEEVLVMYADPANWGPVNKDRTAHYWRGTTGAGFGPAKRLLERLRGDGL